MLALVPPISATAQRTDVIGKGAALRTMRRVELTMETWCAYELMFDGTKPLVLQGASGASRPEGISGVVQGWETAPVSQVPGQTP